MVEDVAMLEAHLTRALASEISFKLDQAILAGSAGQPAGILGSSALITVAKASGQAAGTIVKENVDAMWLRMAAPCRRKAVWLVNEDVMAQLDATTGAGTFTGLFAPAGSAGDDRPRLKGRPIYEMEQSPALGAVGDIVLIDPTQYQLIGGDMKTAISADVQFLTHQIVFRFTMRIDGAPLWTSPITPFNGSNSRSPFIALAAR